MTVRRDSRTDEREAAARRELEQSGWTTVDVSSFWKRAKRGNSKLAQTSWVELRELARSHDRRWPRLTGTAEGRARSERHRA